MNTKTYFKTLEEVKAKYGNFEQRYAKKMKKKSALEIFEEARLNKGNFKKYGNITNN